MSNCTFLDNFAGYSAGAIGNFDASSPRVTRCVFRDNSTEIFGGAVANWQDCRPVFKECIFSGNRAEFDGRVVALYRGDGGAVANVDASAPTFENCIFSGNSASARGGAMTNMPAAVTIANCTISGNHAERFCGGVWSEAASEVRLDNCILWGNTDGRSDQQIELAQIVAEGSNVQVRYCDVQGWSGERGRHRQFRSGPAVRRPERRRLPSPERRPAMGLPEQAMDQRHGDKSLHRRGQSRMPAGRRAPDHPG